MPLGWRLNAVGCVQTGQDELDARSATAGVLARVTSKALSQIGGTRLTSSA